jgi:hypothetical protein
VTNRGPADRARYTSSISTIRLPARTIIVIEFLNIVFITSFLSSKIAFLSLLTYNISLYLLIDYSLNLWLFFRFYRLFSLYN